MGMTIISPEGIKYILKPLKYSPKYSVILEVDPSIRYLVASDHEATAPDSRSDEEKLKLSLYESFIQNLPKEFGKSIKGEIE